MESTTKHLRIPNNLINFIEQRKEDNFTQKLIAIIEQDFNRPKDEKQRAFSLIIKLLPENKWNTVKDLWPEEYKTFAFAVLKQEDELYRESCGELTEENTTRKLNTIKYKVIGNTIVLFENIYDKIYTEFILDRNKVPYQSDVRYEGYKLYHFLFVPQYSQIKNL